MQLTSHNIRTDNVKIEGSKELPSSLLVSTLLITAERKHKNIDIEMMLCVSCTVTIIRDGDDDVTVLLQRQDRIHPSTYSYSFFLFQLQGRKCMTFSFLNVKLCKSHQLV